MGKTILSFLLVCVMLMTAACGKGSGDGLQSVEEASGELQNSESTLDLPESAEPSDAETSAAEPQSTQDSGEDEENKIKRAKEILESKNVQENPKLVFSGQQGSTNPELLDEFIAAVKAGKAGSVTGMMHGYTVPMVYELVNQPGKEVAITMYSGYEELKAEKTAVTDIYVTDSFYFFTDNKELYFSIPKVPRFPDEVIEGYLPGSDLAGAKVSARQAEEAAKKIAAILSGYTNYIYENKLGDPMSTRGLMITEDFSARSTLDPELVAKADGAVKILGREYYQVSLCLGAGDLMEAYYIGAEEDSDIFSVSMADGGIVPIGYKNAEHIAAGE